METEELVNTMHPSQAKLEAQKAGDTLCDVDAGGSAVKLPDRLPEVKAEKVGETLTTFNAGCHANKDRAQDCCQNTGTRGGQGTDRHLS